MIDTLSAYLLPAIIMLFILSGIFKNVNIFDEFIKGAEEGLKTQLKIVPSIVALVLAVEMFEASGALDVITWGLQPLANAINMPAEVVPMMILRPISGGGAIALLNKTLQTYGPISKIGLVSSVMCGSSETTFYTIAVYYGACGVKKTRHTVIAALAADAAAAILSVIIVNLLL